MLGQELIKIREALGISQRDLAERAGMPQSSVCRLEKHGADPRISTVKRVAEALGVSMGRLLDEGPEEKRSAA